MSVLQESTTAMITQVVITRMEDLFVLATQATVAMESVVTVGISYSFILAGSKIHYLKDHKKSIHCTKNIK